MKILCELEIKKKIEKIITHERQRFTCSASLFTDNVQESFNKNKK